MPAAQQRERRCNQTQDRNVVPARRQPAQRAGHRFGRLGIGAGDDQSGQPAEGRHRHHLALFGFGGQEARPVPRRQGGDHGMMGLRGLQKHQSRLLRPSGAARYLVEQLPGAFARATVAAGQAQIRVEHANQGEVGEMKVNPNLTDINPELSV
jgi:hypothetical protein